MTNAYAAHPIALSITGENAIIYSIIKRTGAGHVDFQLSFFFDSFYWEFYIKVLRWTSIEATKIYFWFSVDGSSATAAVTARRVGYYEVGALCWIHY